MLVALQRSAHVFGEREAIVTGGESLSYSQLWSQIVALADGFCERLQPGEGCLFVARNTAASIAAFYALLRAGGVPYLADPKWTERELVPTAERLGLRRLLRDDERAGLVIEEAGARSARAVHDERTAFVRFTSGSSGRSRALAFSQDAALSAAVNWRGATGLDAGARVLCVASLNNGLAFNTSLLPVFLGGGTLALHAGELLPSAVCRTAEALAPTVFVAFPFLFEQLVAREERLRAAFRELAYAVSSAAPIADAVRERWRAATGSPIVNYYGVAEVGPVTFDRLQAPGSVGRAIPGVELAVVGADGEPLAAGARGRIAVRSASRALRYLDAEGAPLSDDLDARGYYLTRDCGSLDPQGQLFLAGRLGSVVNIAGNKVDPRDVESAIRRLPSVTDVVVRAESGASRVYLAAYVESAELSPSAVRRHCLETLPEVGVPHKVRVLRAFPRSAAGKVMSAGLE